MRTHDRRAVVRAATFVLGCTVLVACASEVPPTPKPTHKPAPVQGPVVTTLQSATDAALTDAASRTGIKRTELEVLSAEAVTWSDGSLGCPQPGMMYTQALVPGFRIRSPGRYRDARLSRRAPWGADVLPGGASCAARLRRRRDLTHFPSAKENAPGISPRGVS